MGLGGGKGAPAPPNFTDASTPTQSNAVGATQRWQQGPNGKWSGNSSFGGPAGQAVGSMQNQLAGAWGTPLDNGQQARTAATNSIYGQETSRLDPMWDQRQHSMQTDLINQGVDPNSEAYAKAAGNFGRDRNDAYSSALRDAITGGGQEAQRQQQLDLNSRMAPEQALGGMQAMSGQAQNPLLPAAIAQYQGELQKYGIQQSGKNSMMGGLAGIGGDVGAAYAGKSDERVKYDIKRHEP